MTAIASPLESFTIRIFPDGRMDVKNAAQYLGLKEKTLAMMRSNGSGPQFIKKGRVFYFKEDLDAWLNADGKFVSTAQSFIKGGVH
ncbi:MAG: hypothetical protein K0S08_727 [Gammaproteobacteria bacterium]|jgi:hypothetical protein|nr:hypothetical protein [Gammaproteobacteria bacterium]